MRAALDTLIVCPGRHGDILSALPIAWHLARQGQRIGWAVTPEYAPTLEAASYVTPVIWNGWFMDGERAATDLRHLARRVLNLRVPGRMPDTPLTDSFAREMWALAGMAHLWHALPLILDRRDRKREAALLSRTTFDGDDPLLLLSLGGHSSPFPWAEDVKKWACKWWPWDITLLHEVHADRLCDLCGLFDRADLLIATDSAPLHLSYATGIPTVGLQTDTPTRWHGTPRRRHWVAAVRYGQAPDWLHRHPPLPRSFAHPNLQGRHRPRHRHQPGSAGLSV